jgi:DNA-binding NtrC family response regulator
MKEIKETILVIDDDKSLRESLRMLLSDKYRVVFARSGKEAFELLRKESPDLVFCDIRMPEMNGLDVLSRIKGSEPELEVIMITAVNTVGSAVEAMRRGAYDYITKPFDIEAISALIENVLEKKRLQTENTFLKEQIEKQFQFEKIVGRTPVMREVFSLIGQISKSDSTVLISGESGTGKEMAARAIHNLCSRSQKLFVPVNCAAIPENLLESELFGHERGAFTGAFERKLGKFEIADSGTLFLDEVGSLPLAMQGKLLRALQEREIERVGGTKPIPINVRIISATNIDLKEEIAAKKFRKDLFFRINVIPLALPPLRERKADIQLLLEHFLNKFNHEFGKSQKGFSKEALEHLTVYPWPGNVRELQNLVERLVVLAKGDYITLDDLPKDVSEPTEELSAPPDFLSLPYKEAQRKFETLFITKALEKTGGKKTKAAKMLGIHRNTLLQIERRIKSSD